MSGETGTLEVWRSFRGDPATDLAREEWMVRSAETRGPVLFLYGWSRPVLVLGYNQDPATVDLQACAARGVPVLRRITGGTGVMHGADLALSLALPPDHAWARSIAGLYERFLAAIVLALDSRGIALQRPAPRSGPRGPRSPICFEDDFGETLLAAGRKCIGCAQARRKQGVLIHGILLRGVDAALQAAVYRADPSRIGAMLGPVCRRPPSRETLSEALRQALADALHASPRDARPPGMPADLAARYDDPKWAPRPGESLPLPTGQPRPGPAG